MREPRRAIVVGVAMLLALAAPPASACSDHAPGTEPATAQAGTRSPLVAGEVLEIDAEASTVTMRHAAIPALRMKAMQSMSFRTTTPALTDGLAVGDKVRFRARLVGGRPTVQEIRRVRNNGPSR